MRTLCLALACASTQLTRLLPHARGILIKVATIGYGREPEFEPHAPDEPNTQQRIAHALRHDPVFREAARAESIDPDKTPDPSSLGQSHKSAAEVKRGRRRRPGARRLVRAKL